MKTSFAIAVSMHLCGTAFAENWPSFRGPNGTGLGTGSPPVTWNVETGENVKWKTRIPGLAHSSPIVWGDRVFLTTAVSMTNEESLQTGWMGGGGESPNESGEWEWHVLCLDKKTGKIMWDQTAHRGVPKFKRHVKATHANSTPATDGKHVVSFFASEGLHCHDATGKLLWKKDLGPIKAAPGDGPELEWGVANSPIIFEDKVILQSDSVQGSFWAAFDVASGSELMRVDRGDNTTWCTPAIHKGPKLTQVICNGFKKMAGYDLATGKELWQLHGGGDVPVPTPIVAGDLFFITNSHGRRPIYVVRADATGDLTPPAEDQGPAAPAALPAGLAWYKPIKGSYMPTPIVVGDVFYVADDNGIFTGFEAKTGEQLLRERLPAGGNSTFSASPVHADGRIYTTSEDGQIDVVKAGRKFELLGSNRMKEICMATPAISEGVLFIRGKDHLFCIGK
jgi:outer membrane protein assembly factor BamB